MENFHSVCGTVNGCEGVAWGNWRI